MVFESEHNDKNFQGFESKQGDVGHERENRKEGAGSHLCMSTNP